MMDLRGCEPSQLESRAGRQHQVVAEQRDVLTVAVIFGGSLRY